MKTENPSRLLALLLITVISPASAQNPVSIVVVPANSSVALGQTVHLITAGYFDDGSLRGLAQVETLASGLTRVSRLALDAADVFWTETAPGNASIKNGSLKRVAKGGGMPLSVLTGLGWPYGGLVLDDTHAYFTDDWDGTVQKVPKAGGAATLLQPGLCCPSGPSVDATHVYFAQYRGDLGQGRVNKIPLGGGALTPLAAAQIRPTFTALDATDVYFQDAEVLHGCPRTIRKVPKACGSVSTVVTELACLGDGFVLDESSLYWTVAGAGGEVRRAPKSGGPVTVLASGLNNPNNLKIDGTFAYWAARGNGGASEGAIQAVPLTGGPVITLATGLTLPFNDLAVDDTHTYWAEPGISPHVGIGAVKRVAKQGVGVTWSSSNPAVATIDAAGRATLAGEGTTTITATFAGVMGQTSLRVVSPVALAIHLYAGVTLTGPVGAQYRIEYAPSVGNTNNWQTLTNLTLPASPYVLIDYDSPNASQRFYRAVRLP